jgi:hypothetical protein
MRALPKIAFAKLRKVYVKRSDVVRLIEERTFHDRMDSPVRRAVRKSKSEKR